MFISTKQLVNLYGIDEEIARFFVDREPPIDNLYWHEKLLYLRPAPGYLFIPLIVDLLYKLGLEKTHLLSEGFVGLMEQVGHISALEETRKITSKEAIEQCGGLVQSACINNKWLKKVNDYFDDKTDNLLCKYATPFKSLHRGDVFLFSLSALPFDPSYFEKIAKQWFALISTLLLLDDAEDLESDKISGDENAFLESGLTAAGFEQITFLVDGNIAKIAAVNASIARELQRQFKEHSQLPAIVKQINHSV